MSSSRSLSGGSGWRPGSFGVCIRQIFTRTEPSACPAGVGQELERLDVDHHLVVHRVVAVARRRAADADPAAEQPHAAWPGEVRLAHEAGDFDHRSLALPDVVQHAPRSRETEPSAGLNAGGGDLAAFRLADDEGAVFG